MKKNRKSKKEYSKKRLFAMDDEYDDDYDEDEEDDDEEDDDEEDDDIEEDDDYGRRFSCDMSILPGSMIFTLREERTELLHKEFRRKRKSSPLMRSKEHTGTLTK